MFTMLRDELYCHLFTHLNSIFLLSSSFYLLLFIFFFLSFFLNLLLPFFYSLSSSFVLFLFYFFPFSFAILLLFFSFSRSGYMNISFLCIASCCLHLSSCLDEYTLIGKSWNKLTRLTSLPLLRRWLLKRSPSLFFAFHIAIIFRQRRRRPSYASFYNFLLSLSCVIPLSFYFCHVSLLSCWLYFWWSLH